MNLLQELKDILDKNNKTIADIKWIGTKNVYVDINKFLELADTEYDNGYGSSKVAINLLIVGENWWLTRDEYDGSEWFEYHEISKKPNEFLDLKVLTVEQIGSWGAWETLEKLNRIYEEYNTLLKEE